MMIGRRATATMLLLVAWGVGACEADGVGDGAVAGDPPADTAPTAGTAGSADTTATRAALPNLFGIMRGLQHDMGRISYGLWVESYDSIAAGAEGVASHPMVPADERQQIAGVLGADIADFQGLDRKVHDIAVRLADHAAAGDMAAVLATEAELRAGCVECHSTFRARLREGLGVR